MLPFQRMIVSKSVYLIIIFLSSTSFGFLENEYRDVMSRRDVQGSRGPVNKNIIEKLPFRKDYEHRANEKDRVYENLYDRRSFRTGTNSLTKIEDRFLNERSSELKNRFSDNRERYFQERSRTLQNDKIRERSSSIIPNNREIRQMRENQLKNEQQSLLQRRKQSWEYNERLQSRDNKARQQELTENRIQRRERSPENNERLQFSDNKAREIRQQGEQDLENNERAQFRNNIAKKIREQRLIDNRIQDVRRRESSFENKEQVRVNRAREISEQRLTYNRFKGTRQRRERSLENNERSQFRGNRARETDEQSLRGNEIHNIRQRRDRDFENNERLQIRDNRAREIRERGLQNNERLEFRDDTAREVREHRLTNRIQDIRQNRERSFDNNERSQFQDNRAREIHERDLKHNERSHFLEMRATYVPEQRIRDNISQDIRQQRERSLDNIERSQFRNNRDREIREQRLTTRQKRERNLENNNERSHFRDNKDREIRERSLTDHRIQDIKHRRERSLGNGERSRDNVQTREQRDIQHQRERSLEDPDTLQYREQRLRGKMIRDIKQDRSGLRERKIHERSFRDFRQNLERRTANRDRSLNERSSTEQEISQSRERNVETRAGFSEERNLRQNSVHDSRKETFQRYRDNRIRENRQSREHKLENREKAKVSQGFRDNRVREINQSNRRVENEYRDLGDRYRGQRNRDVRVYRKESLDRRMSNRRNIQDIKEVRQSRANPEISSWTTADRPGNTFSDISPSESRFSNKNRVVNSRIYDRRASLSRSDSASRTQNAQINLQEQSRNKQCTREARNVIERQVVPIAEFTGNTRRFFRNIDEITQNKINLNAFVHIVQVILGVYLIGQIFARSSKKTAFGFHRLLPSVNSIKQKIE